MNIQSLPVQPTRRKWRRLVLRGAVTAAFYIAGMGSVCAVPEGTPFEWVVAWVMLISVLTFGLIGWCCAAISQESV